MNNMILDPDVSSRNWGAMLLRGAAGLIFGLLTILVPGLSLMALVFAFSAYALSDGVLALVSAIRRRPTSESRWAQVLEGVLGIGAGLIGVFWPGITLLSFLYLISGWSLVSGVLEVVGAIRLRKVIEGEWLLALSGVASIVLGVLLLIWPVASLFALTLWLGAYGIVFGVVMVGLGLRLRSWDKAHTTLAERTRLGHSSVGSVANG
jgi:uncharacterized membrane protein HdeD (DUF308 family)